MIRCLASVNGFIARLGRQPLAPAPAEIGPAPPHDLRFEYGSFPFCRAVRYRVKNGWIIRTVSREQTGRPPRGVLKRQPSPAEWLHFWQTIAPLRIWAWRSGYFDPPPTHPTVLDGGGWRFSCRHGPHRVKSFGGTFYPELWHPAHTTARRDSLGLLCRVLDELLLGPDYAGQNDR